MTNRGTQIYDITAGIHKWVSQVRSKKMWHLMANGRQSIPDDKIDLPKQEARGSQICNAAACKLIALILSSTTKPSVQDPYRRLRR